MKSRYSITLAAFLLTTACLKDESVAKVQVPNLYFWLYGADDHVPAQINPGKGGASTARLGEALYACGEKNFTVEDYGLSGGEVSLPSSGSDARIVGCVKKNVSFGFNANRALPSEWEEGRRDHPVAPANGS